MEKRPGARRRWDALAAVAAGLAAALGPGEAQAQAPHESEPILCNDRSDNDGDGYVDCYDQDCQRFPHCAAFRQPGAAVGALRRPQRGLSMAILGPVLLGLGVAMTVASAPFWIDGFDVAGAGQGRSEDQADAEVAAALVALGASMVIAGALLLPLGLERLRASRSDRARLWRVPLLAVGAGPGSAAVSLLF